MWLVNQFLVLSDSRCIFLNDISASFSPDLCDEVEEVNDVASCLGVFLVKALKCFDYIIVLHAGLDMKHLIYFCFRSGFIYTINVEMCWCFCTFKHLHGVEVPQDSSRRSGSVESSILVLS